MPQGTLDGFFGLKSKPQQKQTKLTGFVKPKKDKENTKNNDDDEEEEALRKKREAPVEPVSHRRRLAIMDDDSDEEEDEENEVSESPAKKSRVDESDSKTKETPSADASMEESNDEKPKEIEKPKTKVDDSSKSVKISSEVSSKAGEDEKVLNESSKSSPSKSYSKLARQAKKLAKAAKVEVEVGDIGSPVLYQDLAKALEQIEAIKGRLEIQKILTDLLRRILQHCPEDLHSVIYLASNSVAPAYKCIELGIGDGILVKAIGQAYGIRADLVKQKAKEEGDLAAAAQSFKSKQRTLGFGIKPKPLKVSQVLSVFREIAAIVGNSSQNHKIDLIKGLLVKVQNPAETKYIIRGLQGKLRIGLAETTVLISLAHAFSFTVPSSIQDYDDDDDDIENKNVKLFKDESIPVEKRLEAAVNIVKQAYSEVPSYDTLLDAALKVPLTKLNKACVMKPGVPVFPMLAKPTKSIQEVLTRLNGLAFTCEFKYDGERAQIHKLPDGKLKVFSRNLLETSTKYPDACLFVQEAASKDVESFVMDAECVAYNPETGKLREFQTLSTRKKVESVENPSIPIIVQGFDLMYLNGRSLLNTPLKERRGLLKKHFKPVEGKFQYAKSLDFVEDGDTTELEQFLDASVKGQCEGLMVKTMDDVYEPSRRSLNWLKLKKDYLDSGLGDSFDLVVLGAYHGKGKRTGVYGAYLLACYDEDSEEFQSVCKVGTGFSDEALKSLSASLNEHKLDAKSSQYNVADGLECDVWFDAVQVWEIKAADLSKSPIHRGAIGKTGDADKGIALRFPRFERIRDDKKPEDATTSDQVLEIYYDQDTIKGQGEMIDDDGI